MDLLFPQLQAIESRIVNIVNSQGYGLQRLGRNQTDISSDDSKDCKHFLWIDDELPIGIRLKILSLQMENMIMSNKTMELENEKRTYKRK
uniref:Uncharacterized protein n=1 Tax=Lactuca sativa TaxID=4236 RepID=A0A9R1VKA9_LACSA|nr:hypothetical protein LSAT_V11C500239520 [Lactuca sativa]